ncbi:DEAD/DEAH box helicase family protein [Helicobacter pylori]|nr:DEAD/DEAH box helicase family protein [Helicobacter pylori]
MFASLNVLKELQKHYETNPKDPLKGIIWHTQGSGKTALTYHLTKLIRDFFSQSNLNKKTKFYFIVDRLDLLEQAKNEFSKRGLCVHEAENKEDLSQKLKNSSVFEGPQGNDEIIVVNIQKFKSPNEEKAPNEDPSSAPKEIISKTELQEATKDSHNLQRVFIIDEAHRSYDPKGCFYANLIECDKTAIKIALTGTPLLEDNAQDKATKNTFGNYLHTYSYAESIKDRHTLTLQIVLEDLIALLDFKIEFKESKELHFKEKEEISAKYKQAKEMLEKIPDKQDKEVQKISKELSKLLQEPLTNHNFDGISHSYSVIISQLQQHKEQTTNLLNKYNNDRAYVITHKRLHNRLMEENISKGIFTLLIALKKALDARISKRQEILNEEDTLKTAIKIELRDAFNKNPSLKDLQKEEKFIAQTLFNELTQNHHQGNLNA